MSVWVCSMSTVSQGKPARAMNRAAAMLPKRQPGPDLGLAGTQRPLDWILFQRQFLAVIAGNSHLVSESVRRSNESRKSRLGEQVLTAARSRLCRPSKPICERACVRTFRASGRLSQHIRPRPVQEKRISRSHSRPERHLGQAR